MKSICKLFIVFLLLISAGCQDKKELSLTAENLKCEYMNEALTAIQTPRFSWELVSSKNNQYQKAWQIIVSDNKESIKAGKGNIWDSGKSKGNETFGIKLPENKLHSFTKYYWRVRVWNATNSVTEWSSSSTFITGAFDKSDWKASWIGDNPEPPLEYPLLYKHMGYLSAYTDNPDEEKWVQIDLGNIREFETIRLWPTYNNIWKINNFHLPIGLRIESSDDGKNWKKCEEIQNLTNQSGGCILVYVNKSSGRFIRLTATRLRKYDRRIFDYEDQGDPSKMYAFSLAEVEVYRDYLEPKAFCDDSHKVLNLSGGCKVSCKDALIKVDREDGYDPDMLTDGITNTPPYPQRRGIPPSPMLRKRFELKSNPSKAIAYVSALGVYEITFNAQKPDQRVLAPEWTDYNKRVQYQAYDVTEMLKSGPNVIASQLADGWYAGMLGPTRWSQYFPKRGAYGLDRRLFLQLEIEYPDGTKESVLSDGSWKINPDGPIRIADNFLGESYDANKEVKDWQSADFNDSSWKNVVAEKNTHNLVPQINQPVKIIESLEAKSVSKTKKGYYLFDAGENIAGWCNISLEGKPGDLIILRHGELLDEEGELYTENLSAAIQTDTVILGPSGKLQYEPRFTYHGFRYAEVQGLRSTPDKSILSARVIASDQPRTGYFECSNPMLNQLYKNLNRSHVSNMHGVPTDCPQRDERCGWMGDVYIFAQTSMFNRDMAAFYDKWMTDILDAQSERGTFPDIAPHPFGYEKHFTNAPGWADAGIRLPWFMYLNYGNEEIIKTNFEAFEKYITNIVNSNPDLIWRKGLGLNYGDWLNGNTLNAEGFPKTGAQIPSEVFSTIMLYNSVVTVSKMAAVSGLPEKESYYNDLAGRIKTAFRENFIDSDGKIEGDAQACYALALHYNIFPKEMENTLEKRMIDKFIPYSGRMNTGFHSTPCLMKELVKRGYTDKAYQLLETSEFPSWGYSIAQGATSIWERWDGYVKGRGFQGAGMNSFNHYAFGAIGEWMYENILGIQPDYDSPGFRHFILKPLPGGTLTWAKGSFDSFSGKIEAGWTKDGNKFEYNFTIPPNTSATVYIPAKSSDKAAIFADQAEGEFSNTGYAEGYAVFEIKSGTYKAISEI
ncbi:MAG: family 78 glycoside hydrolase catalytic domain [Bacteroidetes bacterium]|nr:family 78 glycoside hydrolase catalytic domain [Bacteroidota bacterium]